jgi:predicted ATPase
MSHFLKSIQLLETYRDIKPFTVEFKPGLNVIVGENGSGKSTLIDLALNPNNKIIKADFDQIGFDYKFLDTEKNNPRIKSNLDHSVNIGFELSCRFRSHGESMLPMLKAAESFKKILLFIDEPEAGLSLNNQKLILKTFKTAVKNECQVILTTHSYVIIKNVKEVFCMDTKQWITSEQYLMSI